MQALFRLLPYTADVLPTWEQIVITHGVSGKPSHDAHLVALMQVHGVKQLLTFNGADFKRFDVEVIEPAKVV